MSVRSQWSVIQYSFLREWCIVKPRRVLLHHLQLYLGSSAYGSQIGLPGTTHIFSFQSHLVNITVSSDPGEICYVT